VSLRTEDQQPSRARGCLFYGAVTAALVFLGVIAGIYFGTRKAFRYAIETYTTNAPAPIPLLRIPPGQQRTVANALLLQFEQSANNRGPDELVVGEDELNVLVAQSAEMRAYKGHVYLQPEGNELKAFVSFPLDQFKQWHDFALKLGGTNYSGRYLNGLAYLNLVVTNGVITVAPSKVLVSAQPLPDKFLKEFPWKALTQPINDNANIRSALQRIDSVTVQDNKVHVKFKR
jgi:hypothetical protein